MDRIANGKRHFDCLVNANGVSPEIFDRRMAELGLTPKDIGQTAASIAEGKQRWRIANGWRHFDCLVNANGVSPEMFDRRMAELGLTPQDIGQTAASIAEAKAAWATRR
jgi:hypothetical protein